MKKVVSILLCLVLLTGAVFAAEGRIGVSLAPQWVWNTATEADDGETNFLLMAEGANYFGKEGGFGVEYGLGVGFPIKTWPVNTVGDDTHSDFVFKAGLGYKHAFNDMFGINAGLGVMGNVTSYSIGGSIIEGVSGSGRSTTFELDLYGSVAADITLLDFLGINVGVIVGGPVYTSLTTSGNLSVGDIIDAGDSNTETVENQAIFVTPFVGLSFVY